MTKIADDSQSIARRLKELEAERQLAMTGSALPTKEIKTEGWAMYGTISHDYDPA